jgi:glucose-6-phosphate 1-dehydrogenase
MVQNHMLQLLALVAMEPPAKFDATSVRDEKVKVLRSLRPIDRRDRTSHSVTGQYRAGAIDGERWRAMRRTRPPSDTETFVAIKAHVDNWRWKGVPFYLRTGKRLPDRQTEDLIQFRRCRIRSSPGRAEAQPNKLVIRLQPEEIYRCW